MHSRSRKTRKQERRGEKKKEKWGPVAPHICQGRRDGGRGDIVETRIGIIGRDEFTRDRLSLFFILFFYSYHMQAQGLWRKVRKNNYIPGPSILAISFPARLKPNILRIFSVTGDLKRHRGDSVHILSSVSSASTRSSFSFHPPNVNPLFSALPASTIS